MRAFFYSHIDYNSYCQKNNINNAKLCIDIAILSSCNIASTLHKLSNTTYQLHYLIFLEFSPLYPKKIFLNDLFFLKGYIVVFKTFK